MMKTSNAPRYALGIFAAAATLTGCSAGSGTPTPGVQLAGAHTNAAMPDLGRHEKIGYVSNFYNDTVLEFKYPQGQPLSSTISAAVGGFCSRTSRGTFWATVPGAVEEFEVGASTPIKTLPFPMSGEAGSCSIDRSSGDLAVSTGSGVIIFKHASGRGKEIGKGMSISSIGYDGSGNLFADGLTSHGTGFEELPAGGSRFHSVTLTNDVEFPGAVQWDGAYITVEDQEAQAIYGYTVSDDIATLERTVNYTGASDCVEGYIYKGAAFVCPDAGDENAKVYAYPAGGAPIDTWTGSFDLPLAAIVVEK